MASQVGIKPTELHKVILPQLEESSDQKIEVHRDSTGSLIGIEEYVFDTQSTLEITGKVFEDLHPSDKEIITVDTLEETKKVPYTQTEITEKLIQKGFREDDINISLDVADQFKLIRKVNKKNDPIINNAKWLLMERNHMTEQEAFRYIQKSSMDSGTNMVETAQMILLLIYDG